MELKKTFLAALAVVLGIYAVFSTAAESTPAPATTVSPAIFKSFAARPIGPARTGGRIVDLAVIETRPQQMYLATASGGLWKTLNNGTTWTPLFDHQSTISLGAVAVAPANRDLIWVGTGEANARNSVSWGDGVYQSTDGGATWQHRGLADSAHIGRIVIHPTDPDTVYVAALGRLWGPNKERGLFRTKDGGGTWKQVKFIDENTGFIDVAIDPEQPTILYAAAYCVRRDAFSGPTPRTQFGKRAGLYKSTDGGETWSKLTRGLPDRPTGRCGLAIYAKDPRIVYAVIQTDRTDTRALSGQQSKSGGKVDTGGIFRSNDRGENWVKVNDLCPRPFYYGQIRVDPNDSERVYVLGIPLYTSSDGGRVFNNQGAPGVHPDHHALWIDPRDSSHLVLAGDGGLACSYDRGATWELVNNLPIGQFYAATIDFRTPYFVYGGLQDNGTWSGPSATRYLDGISSDDWRMVAGADGFSCQVDPTDPDTVYAEGQYGTLLRINMRSGATALISPRATTDGPGYRFNWNAPILLSPHNSHLVYFGGNRVFRSVDRGNSWRVISPDLSRSEPGADATTGHTITTIAESPLRSGLLYAGTDDGRLHVRRPRGSTPDGRSTWIDLTDKIPDLPPERWITRVECSHFAEGTAFLTIDRHRHEDRKPYVLKTTDYGASWTRLDRDLPPEGPVHVIREDPHHRELLFVGTEYGLFASIDGGGHWFRLENGLPTVAVHDLVIHPRDRDLVIATHGRSLYVMDISPLEEFKPEVLAAPVHLFDIKPAVAFHYGRGRGYHGAKPYIAPNPPYGAVIYYHLKSAVSEAVQILITDPVGQTVAKLKGPQEAGLHRVEWRLDRGEHDDEPGPYGPTVKPGDYVAKLKVGKETVAKTVHVDAER
jgi:photosystem II stability/assembly factor-like uncharacterized protein